MADGGILEIAVRRMLELRNAQLLPPASFLIVPQGSARVERAR